MPEISPPATPPSTGAAFATHVVTNQVPPLEDRNLFEDNAPLVEALEREGAGWAHERARRVGAAWGAEPIRWGFEANEHPPRLKTFDRYGHRIDEVEFHRAWHDLMGLAVAHELHSLPWTSTEPLRPRRAHRAVPHGRAGRGRLRLPDDDDVRRGARAARAARAGGAVGAAADGDDATTPSCARPSQKASALCGMAMTEKQGGSDVRANTTVARPLGAGGPGAEYELTGHKWFCSAPMCDLFLVLAQARRGPVVLRAAADPARRHAQRDAPAAPEGQARQPLQRVERDRAARRLGAARRRARPRRADDHRDGRPHAPGLRHRQRRRDALGRRQRDLARRAPQRVRQAPRRPAAHAQRARRPVRSSPRRRPRWRCASRAPTTRPRRATSTPATSSAWPPRSASTGSASAAPATPSRRSSASAATATSRSRACRACTARCR